MAATATDIKQDMAIDHRSNPSDSSNHEHEVEKGQNPAAYPLNDDDYVVTFKTWVVVFIMASAYGVCFPSCFFNESGNPAMRLAF
jgi:hypothetical protein